jgi:hypothetical protein
MATRTVRGTCGSGGALKRLANGEVDAVSTACASDVTIGTTGAMSIGTKRATSNTIEKSLEFFIIEFSLNRGYYQITSLA